MSRARCLAFASLTFAACDASAPDQVTPSSAEPAPLMKRAAVEPDNQRTAEPRREPSAAPAKLALESPPAAYDRKAWPHWIDVDHDCQDTRAEVLVAQSFERVSFEDKRRCEVTGGRWQCPYTGQIIGEVHLLDVDHLVPLANAHRSGAATWTRAQRRRYANDLEHAGHLVAVEYRANRSKGDRGPEEWLPPMADARCDYVRDWVAIKGRWRLVMNELEAAAVAEALELCEAGQVPPLPQARAKPRKAAQHESSAPRADERAAKTCCRTCKKGKACGDGCISRDRKCTKPPGCACDG